MKPATEFRANNKSPQGGFHLHYEGLYLFGHDAREVIGGYADNAMREGRQLGQNWEEPVWRALQKAYPDYIYRVRKKKNKSLVSIPTALSFVKFAVKRLRNKEFATVEVARARAEVCKSCPLKTNVVGCSKCKAALKLLVGKPPITVECPQGCEACGCYMPLKIWMPDALLMDQVDQYPYWSECWMRRLSSAPPSDGTP